MIYLKVRLKKMKIHVILSIDVNLTWYYVQYHHHSVGQAQFFPNPLLSANWSLLSLKRTQVTFHKSCSQADRSVFVLLKSPLVVNSIKLRDSA